MSLGFFTPPHPDELLYSACARFSDRTRYPNQADAIDELFGGQYNTAIIDLPGNIEYLVSALPPHHNYTANRIIYQNTLAPFYTPFIPKERIQFLEDDMHGNTASSIRARLGITAGGIHLPERLRYCPTCVTEDRKSWSETYWHRIHQLTGIQVCPLHAIFLENSDISWRERNNGRRFHSAEQAIRITRPRELDFSNPEHSILLKIAKAAAWIISWHAPKPGIDVLRNRYHNMLLERGYAYYNGRLRTTKLIKDFINFYTQEFLQRFQSPLLIEQCWLIRILLKNKANIAQHPFRHLLLMLFLECTPEEIFTAFKEYKPFGDGPWPCLNPVGQHFEKLTVLTCRTMDSHNSNTDSRPIGIFTCECGFIYTRIGPELEEEDRYNIYGVPSYGHTWEAALREKWENPTNTLKDIAKSLGVAEDTAKRHAIRLGLSYTRDNSVQSVQKNVHPRFTITRPTFQEALKARRQKWLSVLEANPNASRMELEERAQYLYYWLKKYDFQWFESHLPPPKRRPFRGERIDWASTDLKLSADVKAAAIHIKKQSGRPVRVSITAIIKAVGHQSWLEKRLDKLPRTAKALNHYVESLEDFVLRQIKWAEEQYLKEDTYPSRLRFEMRAHTRNETGKMPEMQCAVDASLERLRRNIRAA